MLICVVNRTSRKDEAVQEVPETNRLVSGPHPANRVHRVFHWYQMCGAVQNDMYRIDGIEVSNLVAGTIVSAASTTTA